MRKLTNAKESVNFQVRARMRFSQAVSLTNSPLCPSRRLEGECSKFASLAETPAAFVSLSVLFGTAKRGSQVRNLGGAGVPDDFGVDTEIGVGEHIAETGDFAPFDRGELSFGCGWEAFGGFADDHEITTDVKTGPQDVSYKS